MDGEKSAKRGSPADAAAVRAGAPGSIEPGRAAGTDLVPVRTCRACGCTEARACPGGCWWIEPDLCSRCAEGAADVHQGEAPAIEIRDELLLGENEHGYEFRVGRVEGRWIGYAIGRSEGEAMLFVLPEVAEGGELGLPDRDRAIRMTTAVVCDPESGYGGITTWHVDEPLRGDPNEYCCDGCGMIGCDGACRNDGDDDVLDGQQGWWP